jgi:hypothetical protein
MPYDTGLLGGLSLILLSGSIGTVGVLLLAVIILATGRGEPDPKGRRAFAVYVSAVSFIALFTVVLATFAAVTSLASLVRDDTSFVLEEDAFDGDGGVIIGPGGEPLFGDGSFNDGGSFESPDREDAVARETVQALLIAVFAGLVLLFHERRRRELRDEEGFAGSAAWRVDRAYLWTVCFAAVLIALFAGANAVYEVFRAAAPGVTSDVGDDEVVREMAASAFLSAGYLAIVAGLVFWFHWRQGDDSRPQPAEPELAPDDGDTEAPIAPV